MYRGIGRCSSIRFLGDVIANYHSPKQIIVLFVYSEGRISSFTGDKMIRVAKIEIFGLLCKTRIAAAILESQAAARFPSTEWP